MVSTTVSSSVKSEVVLGKGFLFLLSFSNPFLFPFQTKSHFDFYFYPQIPFLFLFHEVNKLWVIDNLLRDHVGLPKSLKA